MQSAAYANPGFLTLHPREDYYTAEQVSPLRHARAWFRPDETARGDTGLKEGIAIRLTATRVQLQFPEAAPPAGPGLLNVRVVNAMGMAHRVTLPCTLAYPVLARDGVWKMQALVAPSRQRDELAAFWQTT